MPAKKAKKIHPMRCIRNLHLYQEPSFVKMDQNPFEHSLKDATSTYVFKRTAFLSKFRRGHNVDDEISNKDMRSTHNCDNPTSGRRRRRCLSSLVSSIRETRTAKMTT